MFRFLLVAMMCLVVSGLKLPTTTTRRAIAQTAATSAFGFAAAAMADANNAMYGLSKSGLGAGDTDKFAPVTNKMVGLGLTVTESGSTVPNREGMANTGKMISAGKVTKGDGAIIRLGGTYSDGTNKYKLIVVGTNKVIVNDASGKVAFKGSYDGSSVVIDGKEGTGVIGLGIKFADGSSWKKL